MNIELWQGLCKLSLFGALIVFNAFVATFGDSALAQITPDSSLGSESSTLTPNVDIKGLPGTLIEGGATRNLNNLFHSFSEFNVNNGQRVYFSNPAAIENIFTRVTGANVSNIFGTLGVDGNANLYFLNPNGIIFGENAQLDVAGSFFATTADSFDFGNGLLFSASNPQAAPLLTMSVAPGLQYGANPGNINSSGNLTVGKDLTLAGGNLDLQGTVTANEEMFLVSSNNITGNANYSAGDILLFADGNITTGGALRSNVSSGTGNGGNIKLESRTGEINTTAGDIVSGVQENVTGVAGDVTLLAAGDIRVGDIKASSNNDEGSNGFSTININSTGGSVFLDGSELNTTNSGTAVAGDIVLNAQEEISLTSSTVSSNGNFGIIEINSTDGSVFLDNSFLTTTNFSDDLEQNAGGIVLNAQEEISLTSSTVSSNGNFGLIFIGDSFLSDSTSPQTVTLDASTLSTTNENINGTQMSGDISITAINSISLANASKMETNTFGSANAGSITTNTQNLTVSGGSQLKSDTSGAGDAGNITINADGLLRDSEGVLLDQNGDRILDESDDFAFDSSNTFDQNGNPINPIRIGSGGTVTFEGLGSQASSSVQEASSSVQEDSTVNSGEINIFANSFFMSDSAKISTNNTNGIAGSIGITAAEQIEIKDNSTIESKGNSGDITINSTLGSISLDNSFLTTTNNSNDPKQFAGFIVLGAQEEISLTNKSRVSSNGNFGIIFVNSTDGSVFLDNSFLTTSNFIESTSDFSGQAGTIFIGAAENVDISNNSSLESTGTKGNIGIYSGDSVSLNNSNLNTTNSFEDKQNNSNSDDDKGNAGNISIEADNSISANNSTVKSNASGTGKTGDITIKASNPDASLVTITGSFLDAGTFGTGDAGNVNINANRVNIDSSRVYSDIFSDKATEETKGGTIDITTESLSLTNEAFLVAGVQQEGKPGKINVNADGGSVKLDNSSIITGKSLEDDSFFNSNGGGPINITAASVELTNGSQLETSTDGQLPAGDITLNLTGDLTVSGGSRLESNTSSSGRAGNISINADGVLRHNEDVPKLDEQGNPILDEQGNPILLYKKGNPILDSEGNLIITDSEGTISFDGGSSASSSVAKDATGSGGNITLNVNGDVTFKGGSSLKTDTEGTGRAGNITINADGLLRDSEGVLLDQNGDRINTIGIGSGGTVTFEGFLLDDEGNLTASGASSSVQEDSTGGFGKINIFANSFFMSDFAEISTSNTSGQGFAGDIIINAAEQIEIKNNSTIESDGDIGIIRITANGFDNPFNQQKAVIIQDSTITAKTENADGFSGSIEIKSESGSVFLDKAELTTNNLAEFGIAGDIEITAADQIEIKDSNIKSDVKESDDSSLSLLDNSDLSTTNTNFSQDIFGTGEAGNITLDANRITVNKGKITAEAGSTNGGNIDIDVQELLLMRNESNISTTAGTAEAGGNGGNINIDAPNGFVIATPSLGNSNITANAFDGDGGKVDIKTQSIIGLQILEEGDPEILKTNDITASSKFGAPGSININSPDVDPASAINSLPQDVVDPSNQIAQGCDALDEEEISEFTITGRGGLPPSPEEPFNSDGVWEDMRLQDVDSDEKNDKVTKGENEKEENSSVAKITPATGWKFNQKGEVTLLTHASNSNPYKLGSVSQGCRKR